MHCHYRSEGPNNPLTEGHYGAYGFPNKPAQLEEPSGDQLPFWKTELILNPEGLLEFHLDKFGAKATEFIRPGVVGQIQFPGESYHYDIRCDLKDCPDSDPYCIANR